MLHSYLVEWASEIERRRLAVEYMTMDCKNDILKAIQSKDISEEERRILINLLETGVNNGSKEE